MEAGFHGNKRLLQQSGEERSKLATSERALQKQLQQVLADAQQAQRECARHAADAAVARAELQQSTAVCPLADAGFLADLDFCLRCPCAAEIRPCVRAMIGTPMQSKLTMCCPCFLGPFKVVIAQLNRRGLCRPGRKHGQLSMILSSMQRSRDHRLEPGPLHSFWHFKSFQFAPCLCTPSLPTCWGLLLQRGG